MNDVWGPETDFGMSSEDMRDVLDMHLSRHIGEFQTVFTDDEGWAGSSSEDGPPVDVFVVPPEGERRFAYVTSFGCSFAPLPAAMYSEKGRVRRVEFVLAVQQTGHEDADLKMLNLAANTVRQFAKLVHLNGVAVECGETVMFSQTPQPLFEGLDFCGFAFTRPLLPAPGFDVMRADNDVNSRVEFIAPIPIFKEEMELSAEMGPEALCEALVQNNVSEILDMNRKSVAPEGKLSDKNSEQPPEKMSLVDRLLGWVGIR